MNTLAESSNSNSRVLIVDENSEFKHRASELLQNTDRCKLGRHFRAVGLRHRDVLDRVKTTTFKRNPQTEPNNQRRKI